MRSTFSVLAVVAALGLVATPATADKEVCDSRAKFLDYLEAKYAEKPVAVGMAANGSLVEILSTDDGATWTIVITHPNGTSCLVAAGEHWETLPEPGRGDQT